jgi:fructose-1,6-bisphosphatase
VWDRVVSSKDESREETSQKFTPKYVEDMVANVLESNKIVKMFQAMAIINLKMGNLGLKVKTLKTISITIVE